MFEIIVTVLAITISPRDVTADSSLLTGRTKIQQQTTKLRPESLNMTQIFEYKYIIVLQGGVFL